MFVVRQLILMGLIASSAMLQAEDEVDFNRDIRPLFSSNCLVCHGPDQEERAADLRLDTQDGSRADLGGYAAIKPGDPDASEIMVRLTSDDEDLRMPPPDKGPRLKDSEIDLIRRWIKQGGDYARHWSYQNPTRPPLPEISRPEWPRNGIDHFALARMESAGLHPSPEADRLTLARRVAIDLTGLPPTWEEAIQFANDNRDDAYELFVDKQLGKPAFGERWARVWLDLARYADSAGYADDPPRTIWAYRDYVIRSLNENKPFDQFTIEQIAGDLLDNPSDDQLIATAFHRNTLTNNEGGTNDEEFRNVAIVDRVNTTMAVWMGTTMACAQCHTHKYDPITQEEYFRFFAFFNSTQDADKRNEAPLLEVWSAEQESQKQDWTKRIAELKQILDTPTPELAAAEKAWLVRVRNEPAWSPLVASQAKSQQRELKPEADGWITASGDKPATDRYTLEYPTSDGSLTGLRVEIPKDQSANFVLSKVSATWTPTGNQSIDARFVRVELPGKNKFLHLAELQAFSGGENVAQTGKASQISTDFGGDVIRVNDGITDGDYNKNSVSHTAQAENPWVEIDFGAVQPIDRVVVWNRTDGGKAILDRLTGFKVQLLDNDHQVVWEQSPPAVPAPSSTFSASGAVDLKFTAAFADFEQDGFPAASVLAEKVGKQKGWAVSPNAGQPHQLTLMLARPQQLGDGTLTVRLIHASQQKNHVLDRFRLAMTSDPAAAQWARMPTSIQTLVRLDQDKLNDQQRQQLSAFYRTIAPGLDPQRQELSETEKKLAAMKPQTTVPVMRQLPDDNKRVTKVQIRGNYLSTGDEVSEGIPAAFHPLPKDAPPNRLSLAKWLVDDNNPLTVRVVANRHWEQIFGEGIVRTSEEFGSQGELPSHPQLLDWLAVELRDSGWDLKRFLKLLVTSATYRQSSAISPELNEADPFNRLLARGPRFRISAEMVRDQALYVSGLLSDKMYGPPVKPPQPALGLKAAFGSATDWQTSGGDDRYRRGLYTTWRRSSPYPSMAQFDAPNREVCTVRRIRTNTPLQALVTMNDPVYVEAAQSLARKMIDQADQSRERLQYAFHTALIREPSDAEIQRLTDLAEQATKHYLSQAEEAKKMATEPIGNLPDGANFAEHAAWTVVANVILNLDEIFMKR